MDSEIYWMWAILYGNYWVNLPFMIAEIFENAQCTNLCHDHLIQGCKFSDFSLISFFFQLTISDIICILRAHFI